MRIYYIGRHEQTFNNESESMVSYFQTYSIEADGHKENDVGGFQLLKDNEVIAEFAPTSFESWHFTEVKGGD